MNSHDDRILWNKLCSSFLLLLSLCLCVYMLVYVFQLDTKIMKKNSRDTWKDFVIRKIILVEFSVWWKWDVFNEVLFTKLDGFFFMVEILSDELPRMITSFCINQFECCFRASYNGRSFKNLHFLCSQAPPRMVKQRSSKKKWTSWYRPI